MIQLNHGRPQALQYVVNAAFLANVFADYMDATDVPGWYCGTSFFASDTLRRFAASQVTTTLLISSPIGFCLCNIANKLSCKQLDYVMGNNPRQMSYIVGYGKKFPKHVHHRGASIPHNGVKYSCTGGFKWRDTRSPNPNTIVGAMVGGPDRFDGFSDVRTNYGYTEPTLAGNAGLVAALVSMTSSGGGGIDKNTIFSAVPPMYPGTPPPPPPWRP